METIKLNSHLNAGTWQHVSMEFAAGQVRVRVNKAEFVFELSAEEENKANTVTGPLYVGGVPR